MRKIPTISISVLLTAIALMCVLLLTPFNDKNYSEENPKFNFSTKGNKIQIKDDGIWKDFEIKGVNMGSGYPGAFPNDNAIDKETYYRWLEMIGEMNSNVIRVYKLESPEFYSALYKYNKKHEEKIYIIQNIDFPNELMFSEDNIVNLEKNDMLIEKTKKVIDAIHGKNIVLEAKKDKMNLYLHDISDYVLGYIMGIEWDDTYIEYISGINRGIDYDGKYISGAEKASPFEVFLAWWGDETVRYESKKYNEQHLISYANWADTDPFENDIQIEDRKEIDAVVDLDNIHFQNELKTGIFVSYNIYPYYPLFLQYGPYTKYIDETGQVNPYRKYLMELVKHHKYPVVVSEYGIPSSRSTAHSERWRGYAHGGLNENEQADAIAVLYEDIRKAGCAGSMIFSWQDEWYKRAWNEMALSDPDGRAFWNNVQCAEQFFGILSFEPGDKNSCNYPDGDIGEWRQSDQVFKDEDITVSMKGDERYLHIMVDGLDMREDKNYINLALDIAPHIGDINVSDKTFEYPMDFIIQISKDDKSALYIEEEYDVLVNSVLELYYDNTKEGINTLKKTYGNIATKLNGNINFSIVARPDNENFEKIKTVGNTQINEVGRLKQGNGNPDSDKYDSNADYYISGNTAEIRIPWQLLNFTDPSKCEIIDDFEKTNYSVKGTKIEEIHIAPYYDDTKGEIKTGTHKLKGWSKPKWHERKKAVYYKLQKAFEEE